MSGLPAAEYENAFGNLPDSADGRLHRLFGRRHRFLDAGIVLWLLGNTGGKTRQRQDIVDYALRHVAVHTDTLRTQKSPGPPFNVLSVSPCRTFRGRYALSISTT